MGLMGIIEAQKNELEKQKRVIEEKVSENEHLKKLIEELQSKLQLSQR